jgi:hypothetical protein
MAYTIVDSKDYMQSIDFDKVGTLELRNIGYIETNISSLSSKIVLNHNCTETELSNIIPNLREDAFAFKA